MNFNSKKFNGVFDDFSNFNPNINFYFNGNPTININDDYVKICGNIVSNYKIKKVNNCQINSNSFCCNLPIEKNGNYEIEFENSKGYNFSKNYIIKNIKNEIDISNISLSGEGLYLVNDKYYLINPQFKIDLSSVKNVEHLEIYICNKLIKTTSTFILTEINLNNEFLNQEEIRCGIEIIAYDKNELTKKLTFDNIIYKRVFNIILDILFD